MRRRALPVVELLDGFVTRLLGDPSAEGDLLWIHGLGESGLCFERVAADPRLSSWRHLIPDLAGYGRTPWPPEPRSLEDHARRLARWLETVGRERFAVVGHSMGGAIGQLLCESLAASERRPLAFFNVEGNLSAGDCTYSSRVESWGLDDFVARGFDELTGAVAERGAEDAAHRAYHASLCFADPRTLHLNSIELVSLSGREEMATRFAGLDLPKRYLGGGDGGVCELSLELLRDAGEKPVLLPEAGHWPFLDQPDRFCEQLLSFLIASGAQEEP